MPEQRRPPRRERPSIDYRLVKRLRLPASFAISPDPVYEDDRDELWLPARLADVGLAQWVAEVRQGAEASCRELGAQALRAAQRRRMASRPPGPSLFQVRDVRTSAGLSLRFYRPASRALPAVLFLHGGGFVIGDLESHDSICRQLAETAGVTVVAVDFRRAPEHPGPAAVDDAVVAYDRVRKHLDDVGGDTRAGVALAGDSSGAAIALLAAVRLRDGGQRPSALLLVYPNADLTLTRASVEANGHGWGLEADDLRWFVEQWAPDPGQRTSPRLSPLHAELTGLPPTVLATAEHDPLRDEGDALAARLRASGVDVAHRPHPGLVHGFLGLVHLSTAAAGASARLFRHLGDVLRGAATGGNVSPPFR
jgi:acetyl esterase